MPLSAAIVQTLAENCAPAVAANTIVAIARVESDFDPLAIAVNGPTPRRIHPRTLDNAVSVATHLITSGASVDIGLGQINSANLARLHLPIAEAFQPCSSLWAASRILQDAYESQAPVAGDEQPALRRALSIYNTGRPDRGFANGYVAKVSAAASVPALQPSQADEPPPPPAWDVFARGQGSPRLVFTSTPAGDAP